MISQQRRRQILFATNAALAAALAACIVMAVLPLDVGAQLPASGRRVAPPQPAAPGLKDPAAYAVIYQTDLRRPLFDAPPAVVVEPPKVTPPMPVHLTGTIIDVDPKFNYAVFRLASGDTKMVGIGDSVEGVEVMSIDASSATVRFAGQQITLPVQKEDAKP